MALREELNRQGNLLFRWRSYLPIVILPVIIAALAERGSISLTLGDKGSLWEFFSMLVSFSGLAIRCLVIGYVPAGTSGRNTREQVAETVNTTGIYSLVRHPLYIGNFLIIFGATLFTAVWWCPVIITLAFWLYYERIIFAEEDYLRSKFGQAFLTWAEKTPLLIPRFGKWRSPLLPFSVRNVLKREYTGFFVIIGLFTIMKAVANFFADGRFHLSPAWQFIFFAGLAVYLTLRTIKKKTTLLYVRGR